MHPNEPRQDPQGHTPDPQQHGPRTAAPWVSPGTPSGAPQLGQQAAAPQQAAPQGHTGPASGGPAQQPGQPARPVPPPPYQHATSDAAHQTPAAQQQPGQQPTHPLYPAAGGHGAPPPAWPVGQVAMPAPAPRRSERRWVPLVATAAGAALVASVATAGLVVGFDRPSHTATTIDSLGSTSSEAVPVSGSTVANPDWEKVAEAVRPSVVAIKVKMSGGEAQGSGVIVDTKGHILTNNHVVSGATQGGISVTLSDGRVFAATVAGTDPTTDLAVLTLTNPPSDLVPAVLGDSSKVVVGEPVMAVGNPLGLSSTVTTGIVSALDRPVSTSERRLAGGGDQRDPDRRRDQPRQQRWPAVQRPGRGRRHHVLDRVAVPVLRLDRSGLRDPVEPGQPDRRRAARRRHGQPRLPRASS